MDCMRDGFEQGKLLGVRFLTVAPLNHGSFGMVFIAEDTVTGCNVAIKCITKTDAIQGSTCPAAIATDDRSEELAIHSKLPSHPNIVNLIHHFESGAHQYMVLELCSNGDLYEAIRSGRGPLETEHVRSIMLELIDVVDHMHSHGVFHRDIKPENIFLTADGTMKLGDFGLATTETWSTEFAVGSDRYMAPEQYDASVYGYGYSPAAADLWAFGIVLLNVLFQRNPFAAPSAKDVVFADFARDRQNLFDFFPKMSQDTYDVLTHCLSLDPANRSLGAVREALKSVVNFTTDSETLDEFCNEQADCFPTAGREPLRTPSISSPAMNGDSFPWQSALHTTPQKAERQLSTMYEEEPELFPGSVKSGSWQYADNDVSSLASNLDSGLGMSYKSSKSVKSSATKGTSSFFPGSLPISFSRPANKSPYSTNGTGFSKSWSDLWEEDMEMEQQGRSSWELEEDNMEDVNRVDTIKPSTPQLRTIKEDERQGSLTPRPALADADLNTRSMSPLRKLVEHDKANPESPKQRQASAFDRWTSLGIKRRAAQGSTSGTTTPTQAAPMPTPKKAATPIPAKTKYSDAFASFTTFGSSSKKQKSSSGSRDRALDWRQGSPTRLRSTSVNKSQVWERKGGEISPTHTWERDNNWRAHKAKKSPGLGATTPEQHEQNNFLKPGVDDDEPEWVGGWRDFRL
ncbi:cAMP-dependent protein kinase catalytic subunit [Saxophila tyrrhenica]|uniref:cAMP-dependent protein kinase catalytic subunit n=1 Tax=Saxophila tyrrhenica TaxID=1690608 RepID=A0AAV9PFU8_9PEZI|nr:cAMP-dependent protein kinase catalytic subunit [Saxophila tyrrhenica]